MIANCESYRMVDAPSIHNKSGLDVAKAFTAKMEEAAQMSSNAATAATDLNEVIQQQLQPLLESVNLNSADLQHLAAQIKQQQSLASVVVGHSASSNGSSSSTSPLLKSSESSLSPAPLSSSQQQISGSYSSSSSTNWSQQQQHHQSSSSSSPSATSNGQSNLAENMSNAAAAAAWTNALFAAVSAANQQQQISPTLLNQLQQQQQQQSNQGYSGLVQKNASSNNQLKLVNSTQPKQTNQSAALASLLKANQQPVAEQPSGLLHNLHTIYAPSQPTQVTKPAAAAAALAALADANSKQQQQHASQLHRPLLGNQVQQSRPNFINDNSASNSDDQVSSRIEHPFSLASSDSSTQFLSNKERSDLTNQMDMYMFNSHLMELIKNYPAQLEQFLKRKPRPTRAQDPRFSI